MPRLRWLLIIPVAIIMYTISYIDRTNVSLALEPSISTMMRDLAMDDRMKGDAAGIFFFGYILLQIPGGYLASRWSARKVVSLCLVAWGLCAVGCGLVRNFHQFELARFLLGVAESGVFPATLVLLANWFPRSERARANAFWNLCQPLAVAGSAPITTWLLGGFGWKNMLMLEGALPFLWLPIWWFFIRDHPRESRWISPAERDEIESILRQERAQLEPTHHGFALKQLLQPAVPLMVLIYFLHNCSAYGLMTFFTTGLKGQGFTPFHYGLLFALPYVLTAVLMVLNSWHSDKTRERRAHAAAVYILSGVSLMLSVVVREHFWLSYVLLCLAIPGPFAALAPFWSIPAEILPRGAMAIAFGIINACGNLGGFAGPFLVGWLAKKYGNTEIAFHVLGLSLLAAAALAFLLPKAAPAKTGERMTDDKAIMTKA